MYRRPNMPVIPADKVEQIRDAMDLTELVYTNAVAANQMPFVMESFEYLKQVYTVQAENMSKVKAGVKDFMLGGLVVLNTENFRFSTDPTEPLKVMRGVIDCQNSILSLYMPEAPPEAPPAEQPQQSPDHTEAIGQTLRSIRGSMPPQTFVALLATSAGALSMTRH